MILSSKVLEKLRDLINEETEYRSGPKLVKFFNNMGFNDVYGNGFPSRWIYTDEKLKKINGTPSLDKCIKELFSPVNFIGRYDELDSFIESFNQFLAFDKWKVIRNNADISFVKVDEVVIEPTTVDNDEDQFLSQQFNKIDLQKLCLPYGITEVLNCRLREIEACYQANSPLSVIFLAGSTLEGILLGIASQNPKEFNQSSSSPKKDGKVKQFQEWSLFNFIEVAKDIGFLKEDVMKFSHSLRDFRNYIHPYQQLASGFNPSLHTAEICLQVLKVAIYQITEKIQT